MTKFLANVMTFAGLMVAAIFGLFALLTPMSAAGPYWTNCLIGVGLLFGGRVLKELAKPRLP